ncbi:MAG: HEPN domain-containing protein [candidate division KSB1 bacterium]
MSNLVDEWLIFARESLLSAKALTHTDFAPNHIICFLCQGSAEKYLKAYLISKGWKLKKIHDLADLVGDAMGYDERFSALLSQAWILNDYTEAGRYPSDVDFESITAKEAEEAIKAAEEVAEFVLGILRPSASSNLNLTTDLTATQSPPGNDPNPSPRAE